MSARVAARLATSQDCGPEMGEAEYPRRKRDWRGEPATYRRCLPADRVVGPLNSRRRPSASNQFRHRPRRVHTQRPGLSTSDQAQRGQWREQPRRESGRSWNCGVQGTDDPDILALRAARCATCGPALVSQGAPMIARRRDWAHPMQQQPYCQVFELSWMDWLLVDRMPICWLSHGRRPCARTWSVSPTPVL